MSKKQIETSTESPTQKFEQFGLSDKILPALADLGYETPSPVQEQSIPVLMAGRDLLAQAQTGTGKTAAFALPILSKLALDREHAFPQALILAPTRELALQVAEAFNSYAKYIKGFHVLAIYGGSDMGRQLKALKRGVHVVVGTPGRIMDHLRRKTLPMEHINTIILDEADEMLKMGFQEDVTWILQQIPKTQHHQTALFSATIPPSIQQIVNRYLKNAVEVKVNPKARTVAAIEQNYVMVADHHKLNALTNFLEVEDFDGILIFTRTKNTSTEIAEKLESRGYSAAALNGDMSQNNREKVIQKIKRNVLDIIVATDVAARGIDIDRISHVISFDVPHDTESYIHRIGRTGRAGRKGKALLFVTPRERYMLRDIERAVNQPLHAINPPSVAEINEKRSANLIAKVLAALEKNDLDNYRELIESMVHKNECSELDIAAAAISLIAKNENPVHAVETVSSDSFNDRGRGDRDRGRGRDRAGRGGDRGGRDRGGDRNRGSKDGKHFGFKKAFAGAKRREGGDDRRPSFGERKPGGNSDRKPSFGDRKPVGGSDRRFGGRTDDRKSSGGGVGADYKQGNRDGFKRRRK